MMIKKLAGSLAFALALGVGLASSAHATPYDRILTEDSTIGFSYTQMGVTLDGSFRSFSGELRFDPASPENASAVIEVEPASVSTGMSEADSEVQDKTWFNTVAFPRARFESVSVTPLGEDRFEVAGRLSIKGTVQDVVAPASFRTDGDNAVFEGEFAIKRGDFSVGEGAWSKFDILANDIRVTFRITATTGQ